MAGGGRREGRGEREETEQRPGYTEASGQLSSASVIAVSIARGALGRRGHCARRSSRRSQSLRASLPHCRAALSAHARGNTGTETAQGRAKQGEATQTEQPARSDECVSKGARGCMSAIAHATIGASYLAVLARTNLKQPHREVLHAVSFAACLL